MPDTHPAFACSRCLECCRRVHLLPDTAAMDRGDGVCQHLDELNALCRIYDERPDICRIDRQYVLHYQQAMTWESFVRMNEAGCKQLQVLASSETSGVPTV
ncbi:MULTISPECIES: YkgJ family cysteine cluster protein [Pseudomonas]|uniref:YkgJ family cysteine cluster protein n=1 Tax=Pseudomonas TaxID=286 RepID=UPI001475155A|nr:MULTISPECIES: YkgJ family cysteine cluster protein [Pseudomonas]MDI3183088.1 YkgJ family cysteine cluster protein [Pseudomonas paracarnis]NNA03304.1 YkgJ family cysteine cluster protein [Pseudomonas lundensis]